MLKKSTKIGQPYICPQTKESFNLLIKANLRVFENHRKQAKNDIVSHFSPLLGLKVTTKILNFSNPSIFTHATADIKLV